MSFPQEVAFGGFVLLGCAAAWCVNVYVSLLPLWIRRSYLLRYWWIGTAILAGLAFVAVTEVAQPGACALLAYAVGAWLTLPMLGAIVALWYRLQLFLATRRR